MSQKTKQYRNLLISLIILGLVWGGSLIYKKYYPDDSKANEGDKNKISILTINKNDIAEIDIKSSNNIISLVKVNGKYQLKDEPTLMLNDETVNDLVDSIALLDAEKEIGKDITEFSQFGLGVPSYTVTVKLSDNSTNELEIGDESPTGKSYYAKLKEQKSVYLISFLTAGKMKLDREKIRSKKLFSAKKENIELVTLSQNESIVFEIALDGKENTKWTVKKPIESKGDDLEIERIINSLYDIEIGSFIELSENRLAEFGLDKPSSVITIKAKDATPEKLLIGKDKGGEGRYVMRDGVKEVMLLQTNILDFEKKTGKDLAAKENQAP